MALLNPLAAFTAEATSLGLVLLNALCSADAAAACPASGVTPLASRSGRAEKYSSRREKNASFSCAERLAKTMFAVIEIPVMSLDHCLVVLKRGGRWWSPSTRSSHFVGATLSLRARQCVQVRCPRTVMS